MFTRSKPNKWPQVASVCCSEVCVLFARAVGTVRTCSRHATTRKATEKSKSRLISCRVRSNGVLQMYKFENRAPGRLSSFRSLSLKNVPVGTLNVRDVLNQCLTLKAAVFRGMPDECAVPHTVLEHVQFQRSGQGIYASSELAVKCHSNLTS